MNQIKKSFNLILSVNIRSDGLDHNKRMPTVLDGNNGGNKIAIST